MTARAGNDEVFGWRFTIPLLAAVALNPINNSVIVTALAPIAASFDVPIARTAVLVAALYAASAVSQPVFGRLAVQVGARRMLLIGLVIAAVGGIIGGSGASLIDLTAARIAIGVGSSACYPAAITLIRRRADEASIAEPGRVLGALSVAGQVTVALGLPVGGLLSDLFGWRIVFWINVPLAVMTIAAVWRWIPSDRSAAARMREHAPLLTSLDLPGMALLGVGLGAVLAFIMGLPEADWLTLAAGVGGFAILVGWELVAANPLIDLRMLAANQGLTRTYVRFSLASVATYCILYGLTQWLQIGRGLSGSAAGLTMLPMYGIALLTSWKVSVRNAIRVPLIAGGVVALGVSIATALMTTATPYLIVLAVITAYGVAVSTVAVGNQGALYVQAPVDDIGTAVGLSRTFLHTGAITSSTALGLVFAAGVDDSALRSLGTLLVSTSVVVLVMTLIDRRLPRTLAG